MSEQTDTDREPFRRIQAVSSVQNDLREMQQNLRDLQSELRQLEWGLLGGRSMYDPAKSHKLAVVTAENLEYIAEEIDELPTCFKEAGGQDGGWRCPNCDRINEHDWDDCSDCDYVREREIRTDGGTEQTGISRSDFDNDPVEIQVHPHYTASCANPSWSFADYRVKVHVDVQPLSETETPPEEWVTLSVDVEDILDLLSGERSYIMESRPLVHASYEITAEVVER